MNTSLSAEETTPRLYLPSIDEGKGKDFLNLSSAIILPILFIVLVSLAIYYSVHPTGSLVQITSNFSMSVPLLVYSATGVLSTIPLMVLVSRRRKIGDSFVRTLGRVITSTERVRKYMRSILYGGARRMRGESMERVRSLTRRKLQRYPGSEIVTYRSQDGMALQSIWFPSDTGDIESHLTILVFHANASRADYEIDTPLFNYYRAKHFNLLLVEYRGYGICPGEAATPQQEIEAYYDAEAAFNYLFNEQNIDPQRMLGHGISLGGVYAAVLAQKVGAVILNHPFSNFPAVASHNSKYIGLKTMTYACQRVFPYKREGGFETDLFDNVRKVRNMRGALLVIRGEKDEIMKLEFGEELIQARYAEREMQRRRLITIPGGHNNTFVQTHQAAVDQFLQEAFLLNSL